MQAALTCWTVSARCMARVSSQPAGSRAAARWSDAQLRKKKKKRKNLMRGGGAVNQWRCKYSDNQLRRLEAPGTSSTGKLFEKI